MSKTQSTVSVHGVSYEAGGQAYTVELRFRSASALKAALKDEDVRGSEGEAQVAAIRNVAEEGLFRIDRFKNGTRSDSPEGEAAVEIFDRDGRPQARLRYKDGIASDGAKGEPALWQLKDGRVFTERYKDGQLNDGAKGEPAMRGYNENGTHIIDKRYKDGKLNDGAEGQPAVHIRLNGTGRTLLVAHYAAGAAADAADGSPALVRYSDDGRCLREVHHIRDGQLNDSADGQPALTRYNAQGKVREILHMRNGVLQDAADGTHAYRKFSPETGALLTAERFTAGIRNDGPNGEAAVTSYMRGAITQVRHYKDGELNDAADGGPAVIKYAYDEDDATSVIETTVRYAKGVKTDGAAGAPAVESFDSLGRLAAIEHYSDGRRCDAPGGAPGVQHFMDGKVNMASRVLEDGRLQQLTAKELAALNGEAPKQKRKRHFAHRLGFGK